MASPPVPTVSSATVPSPPKSKVKTLAQKKEASSMRVVTETMSSTTVVCNAKILSFETHFLN